MLLWLRFPLIWKKSVFVNSVNLTIRNNVINGHLSIQSLIGSWVFTELPDYKINLLIISIIKSKTGSYSHRNTNFLASNFCWNLKELWLLYRRDGARSRHADASFTVLTEAEVQNVQNSGSYMWNYHE